MIAAAARRPDTPPELANADELAAGRWQVDAAVDRKPAASVTDENRPLLVHADIRQEDDSALVPNARSDITHSDGPTLWRTEVAPGMDLQKMLIGAGLPSSLAQRLRRAIAFDPDFPRRPRAGSH